MSELVQQPSFGKHGIKTRTFYNQKKLISFPKLVKASVSTLNANSRPTQVINRQENKRKKLPMSDKRGSEGKPHQTKEKNAKFPIAVSDSRKYAYCKASDVTDLEIKKRFSFQMGSGDSDEVKTCKRIKLDINKNVHSEDELLTHSESSADDESESQQHIEEQMITKTEKLEELNPENGTAISSSSSPNVNDNALIADNWEPSETGKVHGNDVLFGTSSSPSCSEDISKEIDQNDKKLRTPRKKIGSLDAFFSVRSTPKSKEENIEDSGFDEPFRILGEPSSQEERNCSSTNISPLLFSQSSVSTSSSKSKWTSPDSQSSITRYFTPLRKSASVSPSSDKKGKRVARRGKNSSPSGSPVSRKKEQMFLDLGQKNFGHITCPTCNMVYTIAQPEDEAHHLKFHHKVVIGLRFKGWKTERIVEHFDDGRVIVVLPQDPPSHLRKVAIVRTVVDDELGFSSETSSRMQDSKTYMFIADKKVVGCVVAVIIQEAFRLLPCSTNGEKDQTSEQGALCCSSEPVRAQCGISRVWVLKQYRRKMIATRILDCVRSDFMFGGVVAKELLAFSDPTPLGKKLAESYSGIQNFLVFR